MAECTISRCSHERRVFRKELHKWSKEILYILGLERLAEELMGARKWKILIEPFTDLESQFPIDWYPEDTCYFCSAKKPAPYDPASGIIPSVEGYTSLRIDTDEHSISSDQGNLSGCPSALSPWRVTSLSQGRTNACSLVDQPLDLSVHSLKDSLIDGVVCSSRTQQNKLLNIYAEDSELSKNSVLKVPQIPLKPGQRRKFDANCKRSYTEDELQAALRDIQSGKLGTRRAAVIYGIPRSTLRNKVYKLANESKSKARKHFNSEYLKSNEPRNFESNVDLELTTNDVKHNISSASESLRQLLKHTITQKAQSSTSTDHDYNTENINISQLCNIDTVEEMQIFSSLEYSQTLAPVLSHVFSNIQHLALDKSKENIYSTNQSLSALKDDLKLPLLPDLIRRLAEERMELEMDVNNQEKMESSSGILSSNVILKVPSFKPAKSQPTSIEADDPSIPSSPGTSSHSLSGNKGITVTLKELISRSVSQTVGCSLKENAIDNDSSIELSYDVSALDSMASNLPWTVDSLSKDVKESLISNSNPSDSSKTEKRTRPKRGRYRNYDRDNLARAVRAVQKGEMSVHRAGTFYGVPHSTLEYKVKERHLLRPKKRDIFGTALVSDSPESVSSLKSNDFAVENGIGLNLNSTKMSSETLNGEHRVSPDLELSHRPSVGSYPSPLSLWQNMPFLSLDFSQLNSDNFFASHMMKKLQENARLHEEMQKRNGQDLSIVENIIKSSLERY